MIRRGTCTIFAATFAAAATLFSSAVDGQLPACTTNDKPNIVYRLWNTDTDTAIGRLPNVINLCDYGDAGLSIQVRATNCYLDSVKFKLFKGKTPTTDALLLKMKEGRAPFTLGGDTKTTDGQNDVFPVDQLQIPGEYYLEINPIPGMKTSVAFTVKACDPYVCFGPGDSTDYNEELRNAVNDYLEDSGPNTAVAKKYGWPIGKWCVSNVKNFRSVFADAATFNEYIGNWDTSNAETMSGMFSFATNFNQDISKWKVSRVTNMSFMFRGATNFNQDLSKWNVGNVQIFTRMFNGAANFNGNVKSWNVKSALYTNHMFNAAYSFDQDISPWDVSNVRSFDEMFERATNFNQNLCEWGNKIDPTRLGYTLPVDKMFDDSGCIDTSDPIFYVTPPGPFCHDCGESTLNDDYTPTDDYFDGGGKYDFDDEYFEDDIFP